MSQQQDDGWCQIGRGPRKGEWNDSLSPEEKGWVGKTIHSAQVKPAASDRSCDIPSGSEVQMNLLLQPTTPPGDPDETHKTRTVGCATALTADEQEEAASTQAVKRWHQVEIEEILDDEDNTSFRRSQQANKQSFVVSEATQSMVAELTSSGAKTEKVPHMWLKPFKAEWTLREIKEAKTESEVRAILKNWIHKT